MSEKSTAGVSRRTLAKGAAWAAPAVAVAAAAPMVAASPIVTISQAGRACKIPGNSCSDAGWSKGYLQPLQICNNSRQSVTITMQDSSLLVNGTPRSFKPNPTTFVLSSQGCRTVTLNLNGTANSSDSTIAGNIRWSYRAADGQTGTGMTPVSTTATPPCSGCETAAPEAELKAAPQETAQAKETAAAKETAQAKETASAKEAPKSATTEKAATTEKVADTASATATAKPVASPTATPKADA